MKSFMAALRNLVLPYGATSGERIVLDAVDGEIDLYNAADTLVMRINTAGVQLFDSDSGILAAEGRVGSESNQPSGWFSYNPDDGSYAALQSDVLEFGFPGELTNPAIILVNAFGEMILQAAPVAGAPAYAQLVMGNSPTAERPVVQLSGAFAAGAGADLVVYGVLTAGSRASGVVTITPTAANTPTSFSVTGLNLIGSSFHAFATAQTSVPGSQVTGVGVNNVSSTGMNVWLTRTNTTSTNVYWLMEGQ